MAVGVDRVCEFDLVQVVIEQAALISVAGGKAHDGAAHACVRGRQGAKGKRVPWSLPLRKICEGAEKSMEQTVASSSGFHGIQVAQMLTLRVKPNLRAHSRRWGLHDDVTRD